MITDPIYMVQLQDDDGSWDFHQDEYDSEERARYVAATIYGGEIPTRVVRIERVVTVIDDEPEHQQPEEHPVSTYTPSECPEWCEGGHRPDWPVHTRKVGGIEINGTALDVAIFQSHDKQAEVALYIHDKEETRAIHMAPLDADALRSALRIATDRLIDGP